MNNKRALVTGGTGFVGSHLTKRLLRDGWAVHIIAPRGADRSAIIDIQDNIAVHEHDGSIEGMTNIVAKSRPTMVFHLASLFLSQHQTNDIDPLIRSNVLFGTQLLEAMTKNGVHRLINTGTSWQHYENKEYSPVNLYAATKQAFETIIQYYLEASPLKAITLKLFDTYGPDDPRPKLFALLRKTAQEQQPLPMSPGEQLIDMVYIDDVVDAFITAAALIQNDNFSGHEEYAVSSGTPLRLRDLAQIYERVMETTLLITWGGRPYRNREVMVPWQTGNPLPGWKASVNLEEGIKKMERRKTY